MLNPEKLIENLFDDKNLSDTNLRVFTEDHLARLSLPDNNPGGIYAAIIAQTNAKYTAFFGRMSNELAKKAISEGLTIATQNAKEAVIDFLRKMQNLVKYQIGEDSGTYQEFYPLGMTEYITAKIGELKPLLARFVAAANAHLLATHPLEVSELITKINTFEAARTAQQTAFAQIGQLKTGRRADRIALTLQLTVNLHTIAINNLQNPDHFRNYYNPSYLPLSDRLLTVSGTIAASATALALAEGSITGSSHITVYNQSPHSLVFSISDQVTSVNPHCQLTVLPANHATFATPLPVFTKYFLLVQNPNPTANGKWKITVR